MNQKTKDAITATAMWWSNKILDKPFNKNNGDDDPMLAMLSSMLTMQSAKEMKNSKDESAKVFENELYSILEAEYAENGEHGLDLMCDYGPCKNLADAMEKAGIPINMAPWKSGTYVKDGRAFGKFGYDGEYKEI